jgi:hypothetical protein
MHRSPLPWLAILGPLLLLALAGCVARVGRGELLLVVRRQRVLRTRTRGLAFRWPGLDRFRTVLTGTQVVPLVVRSRTRDEVDIAVLAEVTLEVADIAVGTDLAAARHPARVVEDALASVVADGGWGSVVSRLEQVERSWPADAPALPPGTTTTGLVVTRVEARLTPGIVP